jgi:hypothetical protein
LNKKAGFSLEGVPKKVRERMKKIMYTGKSIVREGACKEFRG